MRGEPSSSSGWRIAVGAVKAICIAVGLPLTLVSLMLMPSFSSSP